MLSLQDREWKEFQISEIFNISIGKSIDGNKVDRVLGHYAYITRKESNNGLDGYINFSNLDYLNKEYPVITIGNETAEPFVQTFPFFTGTKVNILKPIKDLNTCTLMFIAQSLKMHKSKYSYSFTINSTRLKKQVILLPINAKFLPDWQFMEQYIKERYAKLSNKYIEHIKSQLPDYKEIPPLKEKEWKEYLIGDIFSISAGKRLTKSDIKRGKRPFVGASDSNNGITNFVNNSNVSLDKNVLGVNYNGSVVENFYHPYECIFSDDVKRFSLPSPYNNKYVYLFFKTNILQQKVKYAYGYKFNEARMKKQLLLVPVNSKDNPDWEYMEQYSKNIMHKKYTEYLQLAK